MAATPEDMGFSDLAEDWGPEDGASPPDGTPSATQARATEPYLLRSMARLIVGGAAEGVDIFIDRLQTWDAQAERSGAWIYRETPDETRGERLRFALVGLAALGSEIAQSTLGSAAAASEAVYRSTSRLMSPITGSRAMRPLTQRFDRLAARGAASLERLIDAGRASEQRSRSLLRQAYDDGSTEVIQVAVGKLSGEPAVRDLVTSQGTSMAGDMVDALRNAAAAGDAELERPFARRSTLTTPVERAARAGFASRALAFVIDVAIVTLGSVLLGGVISLILNFFGLGAQQLRAGSPSEILQLIRTLTVALSALAVLLFVPLYFVAFWRLAGATPGKMVLGLRVVCGDAPNIAWPRGLLRYLGYFLSALPLFLGFLWVLRDSQRQGWHDKLAKTHVVHASEISPDA
jgi:uncharacterized RDD family membrane protein YckC